MYRLSTEGVFFFQQFDEVPGYCFTFAIRVSCEVQSVRFLQRLDNGFDMLFIALDDPVLHRESVVRVNGAGFWNQIAYVAVRGQDIEVLAQVLADSLGFGRRFYDDKILRHSVTGFLW